jgi:hypothetical protein
MKKSIAILVGCSLIFLSATYAGAHGCRGPKVELGFLVFGEVGQYPSAFLLNIQEDCILFMCQGNRHTHLFLECDEGPDGEEVPDGPDGEEQQ